MRREAVKMLSIALCATSLACLPQATKTKVAESAEFLKQCKRINLSIKSTDDDSGKSYDFNTSFRGTAEQFFTLTQETKPYKGLNIWLSTETIPGADAVALSTVLTKDDIFVAHRVDFCRPGDSSVSLNCVLPILHFYGRLILKMQPEEKSSDAQQTGNNYDSVQADKIWSRVFTADDGRKLIANASAADKEITKMLVVFKFADIDSLEEEAKRSGYDAEWHICGGGDALCGAVPIQQANRYAAHIFSAKFSLVDTPLGVQAWNQGWYAVIIKGKGSNEPLWFSRSPSPHGWISLTEGIAAQNKRLAEVQNK